jgi:hypothetical protein
MNECTVMVLQIANHVYKLDVWKYKRWQGLMFVLLALQLSLSLIRVLQTCLIFFRLERDRVAPLQEFISWCYINLYSLRTICCTLLLAMLS